MAAWCAGCSCFWGKNDGTDAGGQTLGRAGRRGAVGRSLRRWRHNTESDFIRDKTICLDRPFPGGCGFQNLQAYRWKACGDVGRCHEGEVPLDVRYVRGTALCGQVVAHGAQGVFLQAGDLGLGDADGFRHFHLGLALEEPQGDDLVFPGVQAFHGLA